MAKNGILINGKGQKVRDRSANGHLTDFQTTKHLGYVCGDAVNAYGGLVKRFRRHVLMVRPSLVLVIDDLEAPESAEYQWLLHSREEMEIDANQQKIVSRREDESMTVTLVTPGGFDFDQTNAWPLDPMTGYPNPIGKPPEKQWHLTAQTRNSSASRRIAAIMYIPDKNNSVMPPEIKRLEDNKLQVITRVGEDEAKIWIDLSVDQVGNKPILKVSYQPKTGAAENLSVK